MLTENKASTFWKFAEYAFYAFIAIFPFLNFKGFLYTGTSTRFTTISFLAIILGFSFAAWLFKKRSAISIPRSPIFATLLLYLLLILSSAAAGLSFWNSFWSMATRTSGISFFICLGFLMLVLFGVIYDRKKQDALILLTIISTAIYSLLGFFGPEGVGLLFKNYPFDGFTFGNSSFAGMYVFGAFLLSIYYLFSSAIKRWWMYAIPFVFLINPNILNREIWSGNFGNGFVGEARASAYVMFFSIVALFFAWLISKIKSDLVKKRLVYSIFGVSLVVAIGSVVSLLSPNGYVREIYLREATVARPLVWELSQKAISERPLFGWGGDNFERVFERYYDNRLLEDRYGGEAWFDRAHNVVIDQLVDNGYIGLIAYAAVYIVIILSLLYVCLRSNNKEDRILATVLVIYFPLHFLELQTAFDTTISYFILAIITTISAVLFDRAYKENNPDKSDIQINTSSKLILASLTLIFFGWFFLKGWFPFVRAEVTNGYIRYAGSAEKRLPMYPDFFGTPVDKHSFLWRMSTDFQRGIGANPKVLEDARSVEFLKKEITLIEEEYKKYILENPDHYRAHLSLADVLIYQSLFGVNKQEEAEGVLDKAIVLVPNSPQPYWMKAVAYVYMRKFDLAREAAKTGLAINPGIKQSQDIVKYVEDSARTFPEIDLYFFHQI